MNYNLSIADINVYYPNYLNATSKDYKTSKEYFIRIILST